MFFSPDYIFFFWVLPAFSEERQIIFFAYVFKTYLKQILDFIWCLGDFDNFEGLNSAYYDLQRNYDSLSSSYDKLEASYTALIEEMSFARNLSYVFIMTTIILAATDIYLAIRRTMMKQAPKEKGRKNGSLRGSRVISP